MEPVTNRFTTIIRGCEETYTHGIWGVTKVAETPKEK